MVLGLAPYIKFFQIAGFRENILDDRSYKEERQRTGKARIERRLFTSKCCHKRINIAATSFSKNE